MKCAMCIENRNKRGKLHAHHVGARPSKNASRKKGGTFTHTPRQKTVYLTTFQSKQIKTLSNKLLFGVECV